MDTTIVVKTMGQLIKNSNFTKKHTHTHYTPQMPPKHEGQQHQRDPD
jgi:hypothetical protein